MEALFDVPMRLALELGFLRNLSMDHVILALNSFLSDQELVL